MARKSIDELLRPLPTRVTQRQYARLVAHRAIDSLAIQEHVRRALDLYLDLLDKKRERELMQMPEELLQRTERLKSVPAPHPPSGKLVYR